MILKVSKPARLAAAGCLVFLVYLLYCYHKLPREGGDGDGGEVIDQKEEEDSGLPVMPAKQVLLICHTIQKLIPNGLFLNVRIISGNLVRFF